MMQSVAIYNTRGKFRVWLNIQGSTVTDEVVWSTNRRQRDWSGWKLQFIAFHDYLQLIRNAKRATAAASFSLQAITLIHTMLSMFHFIALKWLSKLLFIAFDKSWLIYWSRYYCFCCCFVMEHCTRDSCFVIAMILGPRWCSLVRFKV